MSHRSSRRASPVACRIDEEREEEAPPRSRRAIGWLSSSGARTQDEPFSANDDSAVDPGCRKKHCAGCQSGADVGDHATADGDVDREAHRSRVPPNYLCAYRGRWTLQLVCTPSMQSTRNTSNRQPECSVKVTGHQTTAPDRNGPLSCTMHLAQVDRSITRLGWTGATGSLLRTCLRT